MQAIWILLAVFGTTCGALYYVAELGSRRQRRVYERLSQLQQLTWTPPEVAAGSTGAEVATRELLPSVNQMLARQGIGERLKWLLAQAGLSLRPAEFAAMIAVAGALGFGLGVAQQNRILAGLLAVAGAAAPVGVVMVMRSRRFAQFGQQLPDALTLIASSIRSGYSFSRAMQVAATELPQPIKQELERSLREAEIGLPVVTALQNMARRVPSYDLELTVTAVAIQMQVGGNLSEVLDTIAETIRERVRMRRQIAALTAEGRLSGWIAFAAPWVLFVGINLHNPQYMKPLFAEPLGMTLLIAAAVLQIIGGFWIWRMLSVDL